MNRVLSTVVGMGLLVAGVLIAFTVEGRGDFLIVFLIAFGGFLVSKSLVTEFFEKIWGAIRGMAPRNGDSR